MRCAQSISETVHELILTRMLEPSAIPLKSGIYILLPRKNMAPPARPRLQGTGSIDAFIHIGFSIERGGLYAS